MHAVGAGAKRRGEEWLVGRECHRLVPAMSCHWRRASLEQSFRRSPMIYERR